jgi:hypothetical protein
VTNKLTIIFRCRRSLTRDDHYGNVLMTSVKDSWSGLK